MALAEMTVAAWDAGRATELAKAHVRRFNERMQQRGTL